MWTTIKTFGHDLGLSCCFRQWRASHSHCRFLHGYAISVELVLGCESLDARHWCFDFGNFKEIKAWLQNTFDHKLIVAEDDPQKDELCVLAGLDAADVLVLPAVGCERFAELIHKHCAPLIERETLRRVRLISTTVREHGANAASYQP